MERIKDNLCCLNVDRVGYTRNLPLLGVEAGCEDRPLALLCNGVFQNLREVGGYLSVHDSLLGVVAINEYLNVKIWDQFHLDVALLFTLYSDGLQVDKSLMVLAEVSAVCQEFIAEAVLVVDDLVTKVLGRGYGHCFDIHAVFLNLSRKACDGLSKRINVKASHENKCLAGPNRFEELICQKGHDCFLGFLQFVNLVTIRGVVILFVHGSLVALPI